MNKEKKLYVFKSVVVTTVTVDSHNKVGLFQKEWW